MNTSLAKIADKYLTEIEAAEASARVALINEFDAVVAICERSSALTKVEAAVQTIVGKVEGELKSFGDAVVDHAEGLLA